jgi:hypothetical protein
MMRQMMDAVEAEVERRVAEKRLEIEAELERRTAEQRAHLAREVLVMSGKRAELDSLLDKLTERTYSPSLAVSDTDSVTSSASAPRGSPRCTLDFIFNQLRPRSMGVMWPVLRAAYNATPAHFEIGEGHASSADPITHYTIFYKCPILRDDGTTGQYVVKVHVQYTPATNTRGRIINHVTACTLANSKEPQEIANFC